MTNEKFTLAQARQMVEYQGQKIQEMHEQIERLGYDIRLIQMKINSRRDEIRDAQEKENSHYY